MPEEEKMDDSLESGNFEFKEDKFMTNIAGYWIQNSSLSQVYGMYQKSYRKVEKNPLLKTDDEKEAKLEIIMKKLLRNEHRLLKLAIRKKKSQPEDERLESAVPEEGISKKQVRKVKLSKKLVKMDDSSMKQFLRDNLSKQLAPKDDSSKKKVPKNKLSKKLAQKDDSSKKKVPKNKLSKKLAAKDDSPKKKVRKNKLSKKQAQEDDSSEKQLCNDELSEKVAQKDDLLKKKVRKNKLLKKLAQKDESSKKIEANDVLLKTPLPVNYAPKEYQPRDCVPRKPGKYLDIDYQNDPDIIRYEGFYIHQKSKERLDEYKVELTQKGLSGEDLRKVFRKECRKEERSVKRDKKPKVLEPSRVG